MVPVNIPDLVKFTDGDVWLADAIALMYHQMYMVRQQDKRKKKKSWWYKENLVSMDSRKLRRIITKNYQKRVVKFMLKNRILREHRNPDGGPSFITGERCKLYGIPSRLLTLENGRHFRKHLVTTYKLLKNVSNVVAEERQAREQEMIQRGNHYPILAEMTTQLKPTSDLVAKLIALDEGDRPSPLTVERADCFVDQYAGRFYSPFTNLKKNMRRYYRFTGHESEPHALLDFRCSQPLMLGYILRYPFILEKFMPEFCELIPALYGVSRERNTAKYFNACRSGKLYPLWLTKRELLSISEMKQAVLTDEQKKIAKDELFWILFGPVPKNLLRKKEDNTTEPVNVFKCTFPHVLAMVEAIKTLGVEEFPFLKHIYYDENNVFLPSELKHKIISYLTQRLETIIIHDVIAPRLIEEGIGPFVTIHDCYWLPSSYVDRAKLIIEGAFTELGLPAPTIKCDKL